MQTRIVTFAGPPGSGKSTQAQFVSEYCGLTYFDTGSMFRRLKAEGFSTPEMDKGELMDPATTLELTIKELKKLVEENPAGISISGSLRTLEESFGRDRHGGLIKWLDETFGKENLIFFRINLSEEEASKRNATRGEGRQDDDPELMKTRLKEYNTRTAPAFDELKGRGYRVIDVDGAPRREEIFETIKKHLE